MYYLNENVKKLNRIFDQNSRREYLRLDLNENPGGLPREFIKKVLDEVDERLVAEYPETLEFSEFLAQQIGCEIDNLCLVNGSAEGIRYVIEGFTSPAGKIVGVVPTYAMYEVYSDMYGRQFEKVLYNNELKMPVERIVSKLSEDVQLLILVNPNNPMGNVYSESEMNEILLVAENKKITVLIDEAYFHFYPKSFMHFALNHEHVFVTRTFSKLFSMAGLRLGYVVGWKEGINIVQKMCTPHNVNAVSLLFAKKVMEEDGLLQELIDKHREGREYLIKSLNENKYFYKGEAGNYIFIKPKTDANQIMKKMKEIKGILIKTYDDVGKLGCCLRVTTAEKKYMEQFMLALIELDK